MSEPTVTATLDLIDELIEANKPDPDVCSFCHENKAGEMGAHAGHTHVCLDCLGCADVSDG